MAGKNKFFMASKEDNKYDVFDKNKPMTKKARKGKGKKGK